MKSSTLQEFSSFKFLEKITIICICLLPACHFTFNNWTGIWLVLSSLFSLISIMTTRGMVKEVLKNPMSKWIIASFIAYPLVTLLSQTCRLSFNYKSYLDISPFLYLIPIFIFIICSKFDFGKYLQYILPFTILGAIYSCYVADKDKLISIYGVNRFTPDFSDPLAFGQMILTLGILCLSAINIKKSDLKSSLLNIWLLLGFCAGIYLSIASGSRTGWLGLPISIALIFYLKKNWSINKNILISILVIATFLIYFFNFSHYAIERIHLAFNEVISYPWNGGTAPETSVGLRITFQRLGWFYFSQSPFCGWGNQGYSLIKEAPEVLTFSTQYSRDLAFTALFHNELMTQMVRYGILGILGYIFAVIVPLIISLKYIYSSNQQVSRYALMSTLFIVCQMIAGLTDEFINLKGMVAFYAYVIAVLFGTQIQLSKTKS